MRAHPGAAWRCYFLEHLLPFVSVPAFVAQSRFDSSNVEDAEGAGPHELADHAPSASTAYAIAKLK